MHVRLLRHVQVRKVVFFIEETGKGQGTRQGTRQGQRTRDKTRAKKGQDKGQDKGGKRDKDKGQVKSFPVWKTRKRETRKRKGKRERTRQGKRERWKKGKDEKATFSFPLKFAGFLGNQISFFDSFQLEKSQSNQGFSCLRGFTWLFRYVTSKRWNHYVVVWK